MFTVMLGGAPTLPSTVDALAAALPGAVLLNGYGLTEAGGSICVLPPGEAATGILILQKPPTASDREPAVLRFVFPVAGRQPASLTLIL